MLRGVAWGAMLVASPLPDIIFRQFAFDSPAWVPLAQIGVLLGATIALASFARSWRGCAGFVLALAALRLGWSVIMPPPLRGAKVFSHVGTHLNWGWQWFVASRSP